MQKNTGRKKTIQVRYSTWYSCKGDWWCCFRHCQGMYPNFLHADTAETRTPYWAQARGTEDLGPFSMSRQSRGCIFGKKKKKKNLFVKQERDKAVYKICWNPYVVNSNNREKLGALFVSKLRGTEACDQQLRRHKVNVIATKLNSVSMFTDHFSGPSRAIGRACVIYGGQVLMPYDLRSKFTAPEKKQDPSNCSDGRCLKSRPELETVCLNK